jgi:hypothetical protein
LELSDIRLKDSIRVSIFRPSLRAEILNGNGPAISAILDAISLSHRTLTNLEVLSLRNV